MVSSGATIDPKGVKVLVNWSQLPAMQRGGGAP